MDPSHDEFFIWRTMQVYTGVASDPEFFGFTVDDEIDTNLVEQAVIAGIGAERDRYHFKTIRETTTAVNGLLQNTTLRKELFDLAERTRGAEG